MIHEIRQLLVVDDEPEIGELICDIASESGYQTQSLSHSEEFPNYYSDQLDVIVLDLMMPGVDGIELLRFLAEHSSKAKIILISGYDMGVLKSAQKLATEQGLSVVATLGKPILIEDIDSILKNIIHNGSQRPLSNVQEQALPTVSDLEDAFIRKEIIPYFQPKLDMLTGELSGVEALARWEHPTLGLLTPDKFIPLAEQNGLIDSLAGVMLKSSLKQLALWQQQGLKTQVAINLSSSNFIELDLPEWMDAQISHHQLTPDQITLEVTESVLMQELVKSLDILTRLRLKGLKLSIDDFGTGFSSLVQLYRIPFTEMKIDRSFVSHAEREREARVIIEMSVLLGHKLGMHVVAEGIEYATEWDLMQKLGCDIAQGFLISRPKPADELLKWSLQKSLTPNLG